MNLSSEENALPAVLPNVTTRLKGSDMAAILAFWGFIAALTFINALLSSSNPPALYLPAMAPLISALIDSLIWAILTPVIFKLASRYSLESTNRVWSLLFLIAFGIAISIGVSELMAYVRYEQASYYIRNGTGFQIPSAQPSQSSPRRVWFMNEFIIYLVALAGSYAYDYFSRYRARHEQASALHAQTALLRAELADSRLNALRSQLNPHFLFNTLNAVSSLVEPNPGGARRMIACLSELLRDTLQETALEVSLQQELVFIRSYINIMKTRFKDRLEVTEAIAPDVLNAKVPKLLLQPLMENAIKHGIAKLDGMGKIHISAHHHDDMLVIHIQDNGNDEPHTRLQEEQKGFGLGLKNTKARLFQSYGDSQSLTLLDQAGGGVTAVITLPYRTEAMHVQ